MSPQQIPSFDQVCAWCTQHDNHPTEGWLLALLDGSYSVDEMRAAVLADRAPELAKTLGATTKSLVDDVLRLPDYRGWSVTREDDSSRDMDERLVWKHDDRDAKIWFDVVRKDRDQVGLWINVDDPNDDPYHPRGGYELLATHTAAAVFTALKPILDECGGDKDEEDDGDEDDEADSGDALEER